MENQHNKVKIDSSTTQKREAETDIIKGASDTSSIDATKKNLLNNTDTAGTSPADIHDVFKGEHPNQEHQEKQSNEEDIPFSSSI